MSPDVFGDFAIRVEIRIVSLVMQYMPYGDEQFARHSHEDLHLVLLADCGLMNVLKHHKLSQLTCRNLAKYKDICYLCARQGHILFS